MPGGQRPIWPTERAILQSGRVAFFERRPLACSVGSDYNGGMAWVTGLARSVGRAVKPRSQPTDRDSRPSSSRRRFLERRRPPLSTNRFTIGVGTVLMLVVLRLALGWHFLYEGVWKLTHHDAFLAETEGFLSAARGPAAGYIYGLVPDIDGHQRLEHNLALVEVKDAKDKEAEGKPAKQPRLANRWVELKDDFVAYYRPKGKDDNADLYKQFKVAADKVCQRHINGLDEFIKENGDKIKAHFESLGRYEEQVKADPKVDFMRQRRWDQLQEYRKEAKGWTADLEAREKALQVRLDGIV